MLSQIVSVEQELQKDIHFDGVLREHKLSVIFDGEFFQPEECKVTENQI